MSYALVGLLTLRLPSLGWVLTRLLRHFYLISLVCLRYPLSFVLFCLFRCPTRGLAACRYFLFELSFRFFHHVDWRQAPTASHYLKVAQVLRPGGPSDLLSRHDPSAQALAVSYTDLNSLRRFTVAFPTGSSP